MMNNNYCKVVHNTLLESVLDYFKDDSKLVTHYTSPAGFVNIIQHKELWFGNVKNVNDITEINYAFEKIIYPCVNQYKFSMKSLKNKILKRLFALKNRGFYFPRENGIESRKASIFVLSTCLKTDSTMLWELYCKNNDKKGYSITFDKYKLTNSIITCTETENSYSGDKSTHYMLEGKVVYDVTKQREIVNKYLEHLECNVEKETTEEGKTKILDIFVQEFLIMALFMKDSEFDKEQEYRFVVVADDVGLDCDVDRKPYLLFGDNNGTIASRLVFQFDSSIIKQVNISPYITIPENEDHVRYFLDKNSLKDEKIVKGSPLMRA